MTTTLRRRGIARPLDSAWNTLVTSLGPVSRLKLDETTGTTATAAVGQNGTYATGTTLGNAAAVADGGTSVSTDGTSGEVSIPVNALGLATAGSVVLLFKSTESGVIVWRDQSGAGGSGTFTQLNAGNVQTRINGTTRTHPTITGPTYYDGNWHLYVLTTDGTTCTLYLDGTQVDQWTQSATFSNCMGSPCHLGRNGNNSGAANFYVAAYDDWSVYNYVLSSTQVTALQGAR